MEKLVKLYNEVSAKLLRMGIRQWEANWQKDFFQEYLVSTYIIETSQQVVGAFMLEEKANNWGLPINGSEYYLSKIAIATEYQGQGYIRSIFDYVSDFQQKMDSKIYWDCWAGNKKLQAIYHHYGNFVGIFLEEDYQVAVFSSKAPSKERVKK